MSATDNWCTPEWLALRLPVVDLDPCSNPKSYVRARRAMMTENGDEGLSPIPWREHLFVPPGIGKASDLAACRTAFINCPYSDPPPWCLKTIEFMQGGGQAIMLLKLDPTTQWWASLVHAHADFFPLRKRVTFAPGPGLEKGTTANFPSVLVHLADRENQGAHFAPFLDGMVADAHAWSWP